MWEVVAFIFGTELGPFIGVLLIIGIILVIVHGVSMLFLRMTGWEPLLAGVVTFALPVIWSKLFARDQLTRTQTKHDFTVASMVIVPYLYFGMYLVRHVTWLFNWIYAPLTLVGAPIGLLAILVSIIGKSSERKEERDKLESEQQALEAERFFYPEVAEKREAFKIAKQALIDKLYEVRGNLEYTGTLFSHRTIEELASLERGWGNGSKRLKVWDDYKTKDLLPKEQEELLDTVIADMYEKHKELQEAIHQRYLAKQKTM